MTTKITRRNSKPIRVYLLPDEREQIKEKAAQAGLSMSSYLLHVGIGYDTPRVVDNWEVEKLAKMNGDLGRLGGLLKLWLTDDPRSAEFGTDTIRAVLQKIESTQDRMIEIMQRVLLPKSV